MNDDFHQHLDDTFFQHYLQHSLAESLAQMNRQDFHDAHRRAYLAGLPHIPTDEAETLPRHSFPDTLIEVYVMAPDTEEVCTVEGTLETATEQETHERQEPHTPQENDAPPSSLASRGARRPRWWVVVGGVLVLIGIGSVLCVALLMMQTPSATVTLVLQTHTLTTTTTLHVVPAGHTDPMTNQVAGRLLPSLTMSQQQSVPTSGVVHQLAQAAHGGVIFYNAAPYAQTIPAGTLLTGTNGVSVVTEQDALVPAAVMPTEGQVTVTAHATLPGPQGNIGAGDVYGACCRLNVFVANSAFTGGQDAQTYQTVTQQDVQSVVTRLTPSLLQSVQAALKIQVHSTETLLTPLTCTPQVTPAPQVGMEAETVSVAVHETCTGMTYLTQDLTTLATQDATQKASTQFGTGYTTTGVQTSITQVTSDAHGILDLHVTSRSLWMAQMSDTQQQALKTMLAGTSQAHATSLLLHLAGVQSVSLTLTHGTTLPKDTTRIALLIIEPQE